MIITFRINSEDDFLQNNTDVIVDFSKSNSFLYTFWNHKARYVQWFDTRAIDLLYISMAVFAADRLCLREDAIDGWSRDFIISIPVINYELFCKQSELLEKMLSFLTGDKWRILFRNRELTTEEQLHKDKYNNSKEKTKRYDRICMFSGGLDSFVGAIDILENNPFKNTLFVSHYGGGKGTKEYQDYLKFKFINKYNLEERDFQQFYAKVVGGKEDTTRSRSFMFFSHAIILASAFGEQTEIIIPENGLISLNIPMSFSRIGTSSTRTTHPYYMKLFQKLIYNLGLQITFQNPYQFKTKGEMLVDCLNQNFMKEYLGSTMSCSHPDVGRMQGEKEARHCGYCLPCVIRQAAIKKAGLVDKSSYRDNMFKSGPTSKMILNSYCLGLSKYSPKLAFMKIQLNGSINDNIDQYSKIYQRGMQELIEYMDTKK